MNSERKQDPKKKASLNLNTQSNISSKNNLTKNNACNRLKKLL